MRLRLSFILLLVASAPVGAQHLGARVQWQPEIADTDSRLQQPVEIEITGRATVPALEILSEATGVSLAVAPEDLATVGERKLTIISKGVTLKAIMVQIPEALQECHWDIDESGEEPIYLLHRNAGVEHTMEWLSERAAREMREEKRQKLADRMALARQALDMSPEELAELEKTDILLARSVHDLHSRDLLEILLSLPPEQMEQFQETGGLVIEYSQAPERLREAVRRIADWFVDRLSGENLPPEVRSWRDHLSHATISFDDHWVDHGWGVWVSLNIPNEQGYPTIHDVALHPRYCNLDEGQYCYARLLAATSSADEDTAFKMTMDMDREGFRVAARQREARHQREWIEPTDPALLQLISLEECEAADPTDILRCVAEESGLSIISDYFTGAFPRLSEGARVPMPLWRLLYVLGEDDLHGDAYLWKKAGDCLVFHHRDWYKRAQSEMPESVLSDYGARLQAQGELTIDDLAELAVLLDAKGLAVWGFPRDLRSAGIHAASPDNRWGLLLYASLSPEQREMLQTPQGLSFSDMTIAQQRQVLDRAEQYGGEVTSSEAALASFHLVESVEERHGHRFQQTEFELRFPDITDISIVSYKRIAIPEKAEGTASSP